MRKNIARAINNYILANIGLRVVRTHDYLLHFNREFAHSEEGKILQELIGNTDQIEKFYVDIGAADGVTWSNTVRFARKGWRGVCFEYNKDNIAAMAASYRKFQNVSVCQTRITPGNVCDFFHAYLVPENFGVLSLDIDSYDYFVLEAILSKFRPTIIVTEINEKIPPPFEFAVMFDNAHSWDGSHFYGQSISQIAKLCKLHDYAITHLEYNNIFLVDRKRCSVPERSTRELYERGYVQKPDREKKFPWNQDMEALLTLPPDKGMEFIKQYFAKYEGKYCLSSGQEERTGRDACS